MMNKSAQKKYKTLKWEIIMKSRKLRKSEYNKDAKKLKKLKLGRTDQAYQLPKGIQEYKLKRKPAGQIKKYIGRRNIDEGEWGIS